MRLNQIYYRHAYKGRRAQNEDTVPFKEVSPLVLRNFVNGSKRRNTDSKCLFEMSLVISCWTDNNYNDNLCSQYINQLNECYKKLLITSAKEKELRSIDVPIPGSKTYTSKQISYMLRKYPTV